MSGLLFSVCASQRRCWARLEAERVRVRNLKAWTLSQVQHTVKIKEENNALKTQVASDTVSLSLSLSLSHAHTHRHRHRHRHGLSLYLSV
eukprot:2200000-Rhodomonas_salina.1